jgi:hypothetical protein
LAIQLNRDPMPKMTLGFSPHLHPRTLATRPPCDLLRVPWNVGEGFAIDTDHWRHFWVMLGAIWGPLARINRMRRIAVVDLVVQALPATDVGGSADGATFLPLRRANLPLGLKSRCEV